MRRNIFWLIFILLLFGFALWAIMPLDKEIFGKKGLLLGLDLKGGSHLVYEADLTKKDPAQTVDDAMEGVKQKIERRVHAYGVTEPIIQRQGTNRILVQLPGVKDIDEAIKLIGQTAQLDFREQRINEKGEVEWVIAKGVGKDGKERELTGKYFKPNAVVDFDPVTREPVVAFEWYPEGAVLFEQVTSRNLNKPLGIFLDNELISAPIVRAVIKDRGVIEGLTIDQARRLAIQLNSGALDVPLKIIQQLDVDATLGADSIRKSLIAAVIGLVLLMLFMLIYYRLPGFVACLALVIYGVLVLAIFKGVLPPITFILELLGVVPVVLTLPGIAGFIISLGMAVDANVLIFERLKEELRAGRTLEAAVEEGFRRAWAAIRDSNITTFIACAVLYWLGGTFGAFLVRSFAITLFIGVAVSMFTAIVVTRTFLSVLAKSRWVTSPVAYGVIR